MSINVPSIPLDIDKISDNGADIIAELSITRDMTVLCDNDLFTFGDKEFKAMNLCTGNIINNASDWQEEFYSTKYKMIAIIKRRFYEFGR